MVDNTTRISRGDNSMGILGILSGTGSRDQFSKEKVVEVRILSEILDEELICVDAIFLDEVRL
jgi:hypothetical protein